MTKPTNDALLRLSKRAETTQRQQLTHTFVDVGPLFTLLSSRDHQIVYGRRGTGKTHALVHLANTRERENDIAAYVDLRNIGSSGGIYADSTRPLAERATCLLVDTLTAVHESLYEVFVENPETYDLSQAGPALDALAQAITEVRVVGSVETEERRRDSESRSDSTSAGVVVSSNPGIKGGATSAATQDRELERHVRRAGQERHYVNFGSVGAAFRRITDVLGDRQLWVLLDEWSSLPTELQPFLADLLRRSLFPTAGITTKIAAIEQRALFQERSDTSDYVGVEVGADAAADVNLDDFMVFDNDAERAKSFFEALIGRHVRSATTGTPLETQVPRNPAEFRRTAFTQERAFEEFVRASEGVPRDAINILTLSAQRALDEPISVEHIRLAARDWYQRDKDKAVSANAKAHELLHWIIDKVIGQRRARAFLLRAGHSDTLIEDLYDARMLHVLKRNISTHDQPGVRYDVYKLDYGCYVDLINTVRAPGGLLPAGDADDGGFVDVPPDDYRSIRRAILDLDEFHMAETS